MPQVHLKKHNLYKHSDDYPCQCGVCGKRFKDSSAVRLHERIHSSARPYSCQRCGKSFKTRENLWGHRHRGPCERYDVGTSGAVPLDCLPPSPASTLDATTSCDDRKQVSCDNNNNNNTGNNKNSIIIIKINGKWPKRLTRHNKKCSKIAN